MKKKVRMAEVDSYDDSAPYVDLAAGIVCLAIKDWRNLIKMRINVNSIQVHSKIYFGRFELCELREFFASNWCDFLTDGRSEELVRKMEAEYNRSHLKKSIDEYAFQYERKLSMRRQVS